MIFFMVIISYDWVKRIYFLEECGVGCFVLEGRLIGVRVGSVCG